MKKITIFSNLFLRSPVRWSFLLILALFTTISLGQPRSGISSKTIQLALAQLRGEVSVEEALASRRSVLQYTRERLTLAQISQLAWAGQGITDSQRGFRAAPSAGAIYPMKLFFVIEEGVYVYHPKEHVLKRTINRDVRERLSVAAINQRAVAEAPCSIIVTGSMMELSYRYPEKATRYLLIEAGHVAQNIQLQAVALGLGSVPIGTFSISDVSRVCQLPSYLDPLYIIPVGHPVGQILKGPDKRKGLRETGSQSKKGSDIARKAVLIIASENFRDEELFETRAQLEKANIETVIASTTRARIRGMLGDNVEATVLLEKLDVDDYDALIFVGGSGVKEYFYDPIAIDIAHQAVEKGKILAAIGLAPTVLANAGVLDGVTATCFSSERGKLRRNGARYTGAAVERDGLIITGKGPQVAEQFGKTIAEALR